MDVMDLRERLVRIETTIEKIRDDIEDIKQKLKEVNGLKEKVIELNKNSSVYVSTKDLVRVEAKIEQLCQKLERHMYEHELTWKKLSVIAGIISAFVSILMYFAV